MKKITPRTWLLAACSLAGAAQGQSGITVYGIVDAAVTATDQGGPASARVMSLSSGIMSGSLFGLQGKEELGGGMRAVLQAVPVASFQAWRPSSSWKRATNRTRAP